MYSYFCKPIYNICNPTAWNMGETLAMQLSANTFAQMPLYNVSAFNYNNLNSFQFGGDLNSVFTNLMNNTMQQFQWQMNNGGMNNFGFGNFNFGNWWNNGGTSSGTTTTLTAEEKVAKENFTKLNNLLSTYKNTYKIADSNIRADYDLVKDKASGDTWVQAYDKLKAVYKKLNAQDASGLKATLTLLDQKLSNDSGDIITGDYKNSLTLGGYDYKGRVDGTPKLNIGITIDQLHEKTGKPNLKANDTSIGESYYPDIVRRDNDNNILQVLSAWNNKYNNNEKSIIRVFVNKINDSKNKFDETVYKDYINNNIRPFTDALQNKAEYAADNLKNISESECSKLRNLSGNITKDFEKIEAIKDLKKDKEKEQQLKAAANDIVTQFEALYVALRLAEAKDAQAAIASDYGFVNDIATDDKDIIDNSIIKNTMQDLKDEGFGGLISSSGIDTTTNVVNTPEDSNGTEVSAITPETIGEHTEYSEANSTQLYELKYYLKNNKYGKEEAKTIFIGVTDINAEIDKIDTAYVKDGNYHIFLGNILVQINYNDL